MLMILAQLADFLLVVYVIKLKHKTKVLTYNLLLLAEWAFYSAFSKYCENVVGTFNHNITMYFSSGVGD